MLAILNFPNGNGQRKDKVSKKPVREKSHEEYGEYGEYGEVLDETLITEPGQSYSYEDGSDYKLAHDVRESEEEYEYEESGSGSDGGGSDYDFSLPGSSLFRSSRVGNSLPGEQSAHSGDLVIDWRSFPKITSYLSFTGTWMLMTRQLLIWNNFTNKKFILLNSN